MSVASFFISRDLRESTTESAKLGRMRSKFSKNGERREKLWLGGALQDMEVKAEKLGLPDAASRLKKNTDKALGGNPVTGSLQVITDPSSWATDYLKGNLPMICLRGSISVAVFHEFKHRGVKKAAKRYKHTSEYVEPITNYVCDVLLPTPLYGPFFILLTRKLSGWVITSTLIKSGLKKPQK